MKNIFLIIEYILYSSQILESLLSCTQNKNLFSDEEHYKIVSKKYLIIIKSNFYFNLIFSIKILSLLGFKILHNVNKCEQTENFIRRAVWWTRKM